MQLEYAKNPVWANAEHTMIDLTVRFVEIPEDLAFTANPDDVEAHGRAIFAAAAAGEFGPVAAYVPPPPPPPPTAEQNKTTAERRLAATDWVNQPDVYDPNNTPHLLNRDEFLTYRTQVRAIAVAPTAGDLTWPTEPAAVWSV
jgi:hypothetical protein